MLWVDIVAIKWMAQNLNVYKWEINFSYCLATWRCWKRSTYTIHVDCLMHLARPPLRVFVKYMYPKLPTQLVKYEVLHGHLWIMDVITVLITRVHFFLFLFHIHCVSNNKYHVHVSVVLYTMYKWNLFFLFVYDPCVKWYNIWEIYIQYYYKNALCFA